MSQVIKVSPSTAVTSGSNNSIDENNRNDTDSERGATTVLEHAQSVKRQVDYTKSYLQKHTIYGLVEPSQRFRWMLLRI